MQIAFYPYDITYKIVEGKAEIRLFGATPTQQKICLVDTDFAPYFRVIPQQTTFVNEVLSHSFTSGKIIECRGETLNYSGKEVEVVKIIVDLPSSVPIIAKEVAGLCQEIFEADIRYVRRYVFDKKITPLCFTMAQGTEITRNLPIPTYCIDSIEQINDSTYPSMKILAFDIETYSPSHGGSFSTNPILMISFYGHDFQKVICAKTIDSSLPYLECVDSEVALLEATAKTIRHYDPDILVGYYSDGFDLPSLVKRAEKYKIDFPLGIDGSAVDFTSASTPSAHIRGIVHIDICRAIKQLIGRSMKTDTFTLNAVAQELLGEQKHDIDITTLCEAWDTNTHLSSFVEYNLQDSLLAYKLCILMWPQIEEFTKIVGLMPFDLTRSSYSQLVEAFIMRQTANENELIPMRPLHSVTSARTHSTYAGGFVFEPIPGLYKDIVVLDFRSLFPSIIVSHNISPGSLNCSCCQPSSGGDKNHFCSKKKGFISHILEDVITRRMRVKEMINEAPLYSRILLRARSEALKLLSNSFYGYLGFSSARWYSFECASAITANARKHITSVMAAAKEEGFEVLYGDTDSVFLGLNGKSKNDALQFRDSINATLPGVMELEYEYYCPSGLFVATKSLGGGGAKKRYALLRENGSLEIRGFETVRRNSSAIARKVQRNVLEMILKNQSPIKALTYINEILTQLHDHTLSTKEMIIRTRISKKIEDYDSIGPHVAAAKRMLARGESVQPGDIIEFVVIDGRGKIRDKVRLIDEVEENNYDTQYYAHHQILPAVEQIFLIVGISIDEIITPQQQQLGRFF